MKISRRALLGSLAIASPYFVRGTALAAGYIPDSANAALLGSIAESFSRATIITQKFVHQPRFLGTLPEVGGHQILAFDSALELDTDGWQGDRGDPDWQPNTSLRYSDSSSLDANRISYFVLPLPASWPKQLGVSLGDYAAVLFKGRLAFAVFGDQGPRNKLGEGSLQLLRELGEERLRPNGSVINAGTNPGVLTLVFPGSGATEDRSNEAALLRAIEEKGKRLFVAAGGRLNG